MTRHLRNVYRWLRSLFGRGLRRKSQDEYWFHRGGW